MNLVFHPLTQQAARRFIAHPPHALLIEGKKGAGKGALARHMASEILAISHAKLETYPFYKVLVSDNGTISIDTVRGAQQFMRLKTIGTQPIRRVLLVESAEALTIEAQNAFLKLLEEPPQDTIIIMTAARSAALLPTIRSRVQKLDVKIPPKNTIIDFFANQKFNPDSIQKALYVSEGNMGLMHALLENDVEHPLVIQIANAKRLLTQTVFERLAQVDAISKQKAELPALMYALSLVCHAALVQASDKNVAQQITHWHRSVKSIEEAQTNMNANPNNKLLLTDLLLNI